MDDSTVAELAFDLRAALAPIYRRLTAEKDLPLGQTRVLNALVRHGGATSSALAGAEHITPQSMAAIVAELEARGYVQREQDPDDGRRRVVRITADGREALERDRNAMSGWLASAIVEQLDAREVATLAASIPVLHKLGLPRG
ncbi:MarR family winged helix-turn-helix transcriptional regulator [Cellulomonas sp. PhB150]|uniref:MarR family winged helix-turn-helix transcriptional regulator n=1 Tax=Cellulomonas sp. PhB150 TaxID=2485188 RepID=UPI000FB77756|nr:MarR family transcriptional regulator [Cellulomonas sp. PhB150]ROS23693.1 DNA-binding MarR family transcriptional regulator [Cellulomonas sp. PhB150]